MNALYDDALKLMEATVTALAERVPPPKIVTIFGQYAYRYGERTLQQAIVQKLARLVTGLHAARLLMEHGYFQDQASLQRVLDEVTEDIMFLGYAEVFGRVTDLHRRYLEYFYMEEFDAETALESKQNRPSVPRKKIRSFLATIECGDINADQHRKAGRSLSKTYSGFVHGASPHIMEMYGGKPPRFRMNGMLGTEFHSDHHEDIWNQFYRAIIACAISAKALGDHARCSNLTEYMRKFALKAGKDYSSL